MKSIALVISLVSLSLVGCSSARFIPANGLDEFEMTYPEPVAMSSQRTGSILDNGSNLYPAGRAYSAGAVRVGDIVTILLAESAQASRVNGLSTERVSTNTLTPGVFPAQTLFDEYASLADLGSTISTEGSGTGRSICLTNREYFRGRSRGNE